MTTSGKRDAYQVMKILDDNENTNLIKLQIKTGKRDAYPVMIVLEKRLSTGNNLFLISTFNFFSMTTMSYLNVRP